MLIDRPVSGRPEWPLRAALIGFWLLPAIMGTIGFRLVPSRLNPELPTSTLFISQLAMWGTWGVWTALIWYVGDRVPFRAGERLRALATHVLLAAVVVVVQIDHMSVAVPLPASPSVPLSMPLSVPEADQDADAAMSTGDTATEVTGLDIAAGSVSTDAGTLPAGLVIKVHDHGYGFIRGDDGLDYYFRRTDMREPGQFAHLEQRGTRVQYAVHTQADRGSAGRAVHVDAVSGLSEQPLRTVLSATRTRPSPVIVEQAPSALDLLWDHDPCAPPPSAARTALGSH